MYFVFQLPTILRSAFPVCGVSRVSNKSKWAYTSKKLSEDMITPLPSAFAHWLRACHEIQGPLMLKNMSVWKFLTMRWNSNSPCKGSKCTGRCKLSAFAFVSRKAGSRLLRKLSPTPLEKKQIALLIRQLGTSVI